MWLSRYGSALALLVMSSVIAQGAYAKQSKRAATTTQRVPASIQAAESAPARFFTINQVLAKQERRRFGSTLALASIASTTETDAPAVARQPPPDTEPFGLVAFRAPEGQLWVKWRHLEAELRSEATQIARCRSDRHACSIAARKFINLVEAAQAQHGRAQIELVNRYVNVAVRYTSDFAQHGVADRWTAPLATLASGRGDCEDYAIAKYAILRDVGFSSHDLRLLLVRDQASRQDHAVLAVRENGRWLILDNRTLFPTEPESLPQFRPLFSLNQDGVSLVAAPYVMGPTNPELPNETDATPAGPQAPSF